MWPAVCSWCVLYRLLGWSPISFIDQAVQQIKCLHFPRRLDGGCVSDKKEMQVVLSLFRDDVKVQLCLGHSTPPAMVGRGKNISV